MMEQEKQGRLGNLHDMSVLELEALLTRQKTFYDNKALRQKLPDKGQKMQNLIARIEHVLAERKNVEDAADLFQNLAVRADSSRRFASEGEDDDSSILKEIVNREHQGKMVVDESQGDGKYINTYDRILKRKGNSEQQEQKFYPNRTIKNKSLNQDLVEKLPKPEIAPPRTNRQHGPLQTVMEDVDDSENQPKRPIIPGPSPVTSPLRVGRLLDQPKEENGEMTSTLKYRYDESLDGGSHSDRRAQALSIQDSIQLQEEQKKKHQELQAQQAGQKLTERLRMTMRSADSQFNPDGSSMNYRTTKEDSDVDSDDDAVEDYPD